MIGICCAAPLFDITRADKLSAHGFRTPKAFERSRNILDMSQDMPDRKDLEPGCRNGGRV